MAELENQSTVNERRKCDRIDAHNESMHVVNSITGETIGLVGNVSTDGLMLITRCELYPNGILQLRVDMPANLGAAPITVGAKVLWCTPANSPNEFWAGLEIIDVNDAGRDTIQRLLVYLSPRG